MRSRICKKTTFKPERSLYRARYIFAAVPQGKVIHLRKEKAIPSSGSAIPTGENPSPNHETEIPIRGNEKPQTTSKNSMSADTPDFS